MYAPLHPTSHHSLPEKRLMHKAIATEGHHAMQQQKCAVARPYALSVYSGHR
jgi:hypothetical protein